jgi:hypothetical protein
VLVADCITVVFGVGSICVCNVGYVMQGVDADRQRGLRRDSRRSTLASAGSRRWLPDRHCGFIGAGVAASVALALPCFFADRLVQARPPRGPPAYRGIVFESTERSV